MESRGRRELTQAVLYSVATQCSWEQSSWVHSASECEQHADERIHECHEC